MSYETDSVEANVVHSLSHSFMLFFNTRKDRYFNTSEPYSNIMSELHSSLSSIGTSIVPSDTPSKISL